MRLHPLQLLLLCCVRLFLGAVSPFVPRSIRPDWLAEWKAEIYHLAAGGHVAPLELFRLVMGCLPDAITVRQLQPREPSCCRTRALDSPLSCIATLAVGALLACAAWIIFCGTETAKIHNSIEHVTIVCVMIAVCQIHGSGIVSRRPGAASFGGRLVRGHHVLASVFLLFKTVLAVAITSYVTAVVLAMASSGTLQPHGYLLPYFFACRWSILDQAGRCPVCLRRMSNPVQIGTWPTLLLGWVGTESMCRMGHGFLYAPAIPSSFTSGWWSPLDPSWRDLFREERISK